MSLLSQVIVSGVTGLVSGSLLAPWINWRIEQKRQKLQHRRELIRRWREFLASDFDQLEFAGTAIYSEMRPHLSQDTRGAIEGDAIPLRVGRGGNIIHSLVLDDIARLEKEWDLV